MHLHDLVDPAELVAGIDAKLISIRAADDGQLIYNYTDAAMYTPDAWDNPAVRTCRGVITDPHGMVVARPWAKFFNHGQAEAGELDMTAPVEVTDKLDGSLGIVHYDERAQLRVATRGSFESEQARHATSWLHFECGDWDFDASLTPLVEIIYPANRIVCDYGQRDELVLLGAVEIETGRYLGPTEAARAIRWPGDVTTTFEHATLRDAIAATPRPGAEGLCARYTAGLGNRIVKIKQDDYVRLHRIVTGLSERTVWEHMVSGRPIEALLEGIPDELHPWVREVWGRISWTAEDLAFETEGAFREIGQQPDRGSFAAKAMTYGQLTPWLFNMLDGKDPKPSILKTLRPRGDARAKTYSEATA